MVDRARFRLAPPVEVVKAAPSDKIVGSLSEHESKELLRATGFALPQEVLVTQKANLDAAIARVGFPLVMKIQSRDIPHKSEAGGVRVNIASVEEASAAYTQLVENARRFSPSANIQGVLVGPMAKKGVEMIVGTVNDPTFGPMVMAGFGGVTTELFKDVVYRPAPVSADEAANMLNELKAAPLLDAFRGSVKSDRAALAQLIAQVSQLAAQRDDVSEIEVNPVLVHPEGEGITIVDALVIGRDKPAGPTQDRY
jgi:succinyl-CoA synthetase beta subunit